MVLQDIFKEPIELEILVVEVAVPPTETTIVRNSSQKIYLGASGIGHIH